MNVIVYVGLLVDLLEGHFPIFITSYIINIMLIFYTLFINNLQINTNIQFISRYMS